MKKILSVALLFVAALATKAQGNEPAKPATDPTTIVKFKHLEYDFGNIIEGEKPTHEFEFTNMGKTPVIVQSATPSCGCTTPDWTREPVAAGKTGKVVASYNSEGRVGVFNKQITVITNVGTIVIYIKGNVIKKEAPPVSPVQN